MRNLAVALRPTLKNFCYKVLVKHSILWAWLAAMVRLLHFDMGVMETASLQVKKRGKEAYF